MGGVLLQTFTRLHLNFLNHIITVYKDPPSSKSPTRWSSLNNTLRTLITNIQGNTQQACLPQAQFTPFTHYKKMVLHNTE